MNFLKLIISAIKGDDAETKASKIQKKALGAFKAQIAAATATTMDFEEKIEEAQAKVIKSLMNDGEEIEDRDAYLKSYLSAVESVESAKLELTNHLEMITKLEEAVKILTQKEGV